MPLGLLIFAILVGLCVAIVAWAGFGAGILLSLIVLIVAANLVAGLGAIWLARRRK